MSSFRRFFGLLPPKLKPAVKVEHIIFEAEYRCIACRNELSFDQIMYSHGICPACGHTANGTVCDYIKEPRAAAN